MDILYRLRDKFNEISYRYLWKPIFFAFDPELMHMFFIDVGRILGRFRISRLATRMMFDYENPLLEQNILGMRFRNPIGLSAGFDKNASMMNILEDVGFGFIELGSITANHSSGNIGIRLRRLPEKKSLWVNMGLNNEGAEKIRERVKNQKVGIPVALSIAKTNCLETVDLQNGIKDYSFSLNVLKNSGSFFVINISCPNSYGGRDFAKPERYGKLIREIKKMRIKKPIFVKLSPDMILSDVDKIILMSRKAGVSGFICTNLTKKDIGFAKGGLSGKIVEKKADRLLNYVYRKTKGEFVLVGVGGVFSAEDAYRKIKLGANLVSLFTGMIYEGPGLIGQINREILALMKRDGYSRFDEIRGSMRV
ncbi:MAG: quinone-dependent dihydroorotate dehydrogenase [archaeon]